MKWPGLGSLLFPAVVGAGGLALAVGAEWEEEPAAEALAAPTGGSTAVASFFDFDRYKENIRMLSSFGDRQANQSVKPLSASNIPAGNWIEAELASYGYTVERHTYLFGGTPRDNIYATKIGKTNPDQMYIISGHMDGRGNGGAANDDGSGTALVMELARAYAEPGVETGISIRFALWNNEETGLNGSTAYFNDRQALQGVENPGGSGLFPEPTWLGIIQHDMMLWDHGLPVQANQIPGADVDIEFQASSTFAAQSQALANMLAAGNLAYSTTHPAEVTNDMCCTDSMPFRNLIPSVSLRENRRRAETGSGANPTYHHFSDVFETFSDADFMLGFSALQTTGGTIAELTGAGLGSAGVVVLDRAVYNCADTMAIEVRDGDLEGAGTVTVTVTTSGGDSESVILTESPAGTGRFRGTLTTAQGAAMTGSGTLDVTEPTTITVTYNDADDGTGSAAVAQKMATTDCTAPAFAGIATAVAGDGLVDLSWLAATDATGPVTYGIYRATTPAGQDFGDPLDRVFGLTYRDDAALNGQSYSYVVRARDAAGNEDTNTVELTAQPSGPLDHFTINPIPSPQFVGVPFPVTIRARFEGGMPMLSFSGAVPLSGQVPDPNRSQILVSEIESGAPDIVEFTNVSGHSIDMSGWTAITYHNGSGAQAGLQPGFVGGGGWLYVFPAGSVSAPGDVFTLNESGSAPGTYPNLITGYNINWATADPAAAVLLRDREGNIVDYFTDRDSTATNYPISIPPSEWSGVGVLYTAPDTNNFARVGTQDQNTAADWTRGANSIGTLNPGLAGTFPSLVSITPGTTASFVNGVWTGMVTVNAAAMGMELVADTGGGDFGLSNLFDVDPCFAPVLSPIANATIDDLSPYNAAPMLTQGTGPIAWSLTQAPAGMTIDGAGQVSWPNPVEGGSPHAVTVRATGVCGSVEVSWNVTVVDCVAPIVGEVSFKVIVDSQPYTEALGLVQGTGPVMWSLTNAPAGMTIDAGTGLVTWADPSGALGQHTIAALAVGPCGADMVTWDIFVQSIPLNSSARHWTIYRE